MADHHRDVLLEEVQHHLRVEQLQLVQHRQRVERVGDDARLVVGERLVDAGQDPLRNRRLSDTTPHRSVTGDSQTASFFPEPVPFMEPNFETSFETSFRVQSLAPFAFLETKLSGFPTGADLADADGDVGNVLEEGGAELPVALVQRRDNVRQQLLA